MYSSKQRFLYAIGPGFLMAGAAVGVSHLVQATRAGADYGFSLLWLLLLAIISKYPFMEFGPRYAAATGEHLIKGYQRLGKLALWSYAGITFGTMFIIHAAVTLVSAGLAEHLFATGWPLFSWSVIILAGCVLLLVLGRYPGLDLSMKIIISVLTLATLFAVMMALGAGTAAGAVQTEAPSYWNAAGLAFIIAFMGWMPIPLDAAVWHSIWTQERGRQTRYRPTVGEARLDFDIGYGAAGLIGVLFFLLGALVMFGSGVSFASGSVGFSAQLIELYTQTLGNWSGPLISVAAFITMFSTTLAVTDAYPRVLSELWAMHQPASAPAAAQEPQDTARAAAYRAFLPFSALSALLVLYFLSGQFTFLIDLAAGISFVAAPALGWFNYRLLTSAHTPEAARPGPVYRFFALACLAFLVLFTLVWAYWTFLG
ncbi:MAG: Nramp family divalent metal transporter [Cyclonatronaceae bacterium]